MKDGKLQWHTAFSAGMHIEFREEMEKLRFEEEHILGKKPMQIDLLIIKMKTEEKIRKNIGKIFREHNIIEYKSPEDYLSINDFIRHMDMPVFIRQWQMWCFVQTGRQWRRKRRCVMR